MPADVVPIAAALLDRLAVLGVDVDRVLRDASLPRSRFETSKAYVTTQEFFAFWQAVEASGASRDVGLRLGSETLPHQHNVATMAALVSPDVGEALKKLARYKRLVCPEQITVRVVRGEARVAFEWLLAGEDPPRMLIDGVFASAVRLAREGTGKALGPRRLELTRRKADEAMLKRHFGCEVRFDAGTDLLVFDEKVLAEPFKTHNPQMLEVLVPGLEAALGEGGGGRSLADDVRSVLGQRICGERPAVEKTAKALGMSPRTLQRRLGELGTTCEDVDLAVAVPADFADPSGVRPWARDREQAERLWKKSEAWTGIGFAVS